MARLYYQQIDYDPEGDSLSEYLHAVTCATNGERYHSMLKALAKIVVSHDKKKELKPDAAAAINELKCALMPYLSEFITKKR